MLVVPTKWAMYTDAGNEGLTKIAQRAADKVESLKRAGNLTGTAIETICVDFIAEWVDLSQHDGCREASDTAVRECVGEFHDALYSQYGEHWGAWERHRDMEWERRDKS